MLNFFRKIYLRSIFYDKKISKISNNNLKYKPSSHLLTSVIKVQTKKFNIDDFALENVWVDKTLDLKQINRLNNFFWLLSLDLKSSSASVQLVIKNWIEINYKYKPKNWSFKTTSKRIISWLSNSKLTYDKSTEQYKKDFNQIILKQTSHLIYQIDKIDNPDDKLVGAAAIILVGLSYDDRKNFTLKGLN